MKNQTNPCRRGGSSYGSLVIFLAMRCWSAVATPEPGTEAGFRVTQTAKIGGEGSWDYAEYDSARHRLFVARVGGILVLDTDSMKPVGTVPARAGTRTHGVAVASDLGLGMTSDGNAHGRPGSYGYSRDSSSGATRRPRSPQRCSCSASGRRIAES